jgi:hypothetical protein
LKRPNTINVRSDSYADLELVRVDLEVKEPAMKHTGVPTKLHAIETVSDALATTAMS